jgi:hypothetical protein
MRRDLQTQLDGNTLGLVAGEAAPLPRGRPGFCSK